MRPTQHVRSQYSVYAHAQEQFKIVTARHDHTGALWKIGILENDVRFDNKCNLFLIEMCFRTLCSSVNSLSLSVDGVVFLRCG